jgi:ABC-type bacteriocin/lantibiotic exporter with double-glycine peptidase domain
MGLELSDQDRRFINIMIIGIIFLVLGLATIFTNKPEVYIPLILCGLIVIVIGILNFKRNRQLNENLSKALHERIGREHEANYSTDELSTRAKEWFSKKTQEARKTLETQNEKYTYFFTETKNPPKKSHLYDFSYNI